MGDAVLARQPLEPQEAGVGHQDLPSTSAATANPLTGRCGCT
jgi:hypothetical protein